MNESDVLLEAAIQAARAYADSLPDSIEQVRAYDACLTLKGCRRGEVVERLDREKLAEVRG